MISLNLDRLIHQFLVHSYLYYQVGESIIGDENYDRVCVHLTKAVEGQDKYLYQNIVEKCLGAEGSGYKIRKKEYPPEIVSTALHLLYQDKFAETKSFREFLSSYGYGVAA